MESAQVYAMADDVEPEQFESALSTARAEGNVSRANVVRRVRAKREEAAVSRGQIEQGGYTALLSKLRRHVGGISWTYPGVMVAQVMVAVLGS